MAAVVPSRQHLTPRLLRGLVARAGFAATMAWSLTACGGNDDPTAGSGGGSSESGPIDTSESADETAAGICESGTQLPCECPDGEQGVMICDPATGEIGDCLGCPPTPTCGDDICADAVGETCESCPADCGACMECADAPSCEGAAIPGAIETHAEALDVLPNARSLPSADHATTLAQRIDQGEAGARIVAAALDENAIEGEHPFVPRLRAVFAEHPEQAAAVRRQLAHSGIADARAYRERYPEPRGHAITPSLEIGVGPGHAPGDCNDPKLRLRVAQITVHDEADLVFKDMIYCAVIAEATPGAEIRVTPQTFALDNGDEFAFALAEGVVWGQQGEPVAPGGNLAMTYNCLEGDETGAFEEFLQAIADAADGVGGIPGANGWVLPVIGAAAEIIAAALALENDDHLFNASQVIPAKMQLDLTHGAWWSVRRTGTFMLKDWDWELRMEAWGCTESPTP